MKSATLMRQNYSRSSLLPFTIWLSLYWLPFPAAAKLATDFDPNRDFANLKTFAFIGGGEHLARMQLNPDQLNNQIHRAVTRELTAKGLREVKPEESPDLVARYWVNSQMDVDVGANTNWGAYGPYVGYHWGLVYNSMDASVTHQGTLSIELIDPRSHDLAWRMFASVKILHADPDKIWKIADSNIKNAFKRYRPRQKTSKQRKSSGPRKKHSRRNRNADYEQCQNPTRIDSQRLARLKGSRHGANTIS